MAITRLKHHDKCQCIVVKNSNPIPHYARMICLDHQVCVQQVSRHNYKQMKKIGGIVVEPRNKKQRMLTWEELGL